MKKTLLMLCLMLTIPTISSANRVITNKQYNFVVYDVETGPGNNKHTAIESFGTCPAALKKAKDIAKYRAEKYLAGHVYFMTVRADIEKFFNPDVYCTQEHLDKNVHPQTWDPKRKQVTGYIYYDIGGSWVSLEPKN